MRPAWWLAFLLSGCSAAKDPAAAVAGGDASAPASAAATDAGAPAAQVSVPFAIATYPGNAGKYFRMTLSVNGAPFEVLVDTGSSGLRVLSQTPLGTPTGESVPVPFMGGMDLYGPTETAVVRIGDLETDGPIAIQRVVSGGDALTAMGVQGIVGVSLRADKPADVYSPFAQLPAPYAGVFVMHTGGYASPYGSVTFGPSPDGFAGFASVPLTRDPRRTTGAPAWTDTPRVCFFVGGAPTEPPCSTAMIDTGANYALVYDVTNADAGAPPDEALPAGTTFEAKIAVDAETPFDLAFTVPSAPTTSLDVVHRQNGRAGYSNLGVEVFFRFDVLYDGANGFLGFRKLAP